MAATVDQISDGRVILGIGAAWFQHEHEAYGWDFPDPRERSDRLEEAVELIKMLFTAEGPVNYNGRYYKLKDTYFVPASKQKPHIPIMVGGNGEKRTLRILAKYGNICNLDFHYPGSPEIYQHKMNVLERHCEEFGRDPAEIRKTLHIPIRLECDEKEAAKLRKREGEWFFIGPASFIIDRIQQYEDVGVEEIMFAGVPNKSKLYKRLDEEILSAF